MPQVKLLLDFTTSRLTLSASINPVVLIKENWTRSAQQRLADWHCKAVRELQLVQVTRSLVAVFARTTQRSLPI